MSTEMPVMTEGSFQPQSTPVEQPAAPQQAPQSDPAKEILSQRFAELARREREIRLQKQQLETQKPAGLDPEIQRLIDKKKKAKANPIAWLEEAGLTYDEITEYQLNGGRPVVSEEVLTLQEEINLLKKEREEEKKAAEAEGKTKQEQARLAEIKASLLESKADYELVTSFNEYDLVRSVMDESEEAGQPISEKDAALLVEKHLEKEILKYKDNPKIRKMFGVVENIPETLHNGGRSEHHSQSSDPYAARTLTNSMTQNSVGTERELSDEERRAKAAALLQFND